MARLDASKMKGIGCWLRVINCNNEVSDDGVKALFDTSRWITVVGSPTWSCLKFDLNWRWFRWIILIGEWDLQIALKIRVPSASTDRKEIDSRWVAMLQKRVISWYGKLLIMLNFAKSKVCTSLRTWLLWTELANFVNCSGVKLQFNMETLEILPGRFLVCP